ncbi:MAG: IS30 family transposase, partial [Caryophanon sp.]|nr:IS30 family transposase [Caryophanon sp.]
MSYCHLTISERTKIEVLKGIGYSCRAIAQKKKCGARSKFTDQLRKVIEKKLKATWSPEQIVGSLFQGKLSFKTIDR